MDSAKELLQTFLSDGIISEEDIATKILEMNKAKIKKIHPYAISQRKDGRYITKVLSDGKKKQINGKTENELYKKLYDFYFPKTSFTLTEVYEKWMLYRRDNTSAKQKTLLEAKNEKFYPMVKRNKLMEKRKMNFIKNYMTSIFPKLHLHLQKYMKNGCFTAGTIPLPSKKHFLKLKMNGISFLLAQVLPAHL